MDKQLKAAQQTVGSVLGANHQVISRRTVPSNPTAPDVEPEDTFQPSVLRRNKAASSHTKDAKKVNQGTDERCKTYREDLKRAQDQPQYSHMENKCLNFAGDDRTNDCSTRQQHQAPPANNPVGS